MDRIQEYFKNPAINSSLIKRILKNDFRKQEHDPIKWAKGNLVDALCTNSEGLNDYYLWSGDIPTGQLGSVIQEYAKDNKVWRTVDLIKTWRKLFSKNKTGDVPLIKKLEKGREYFDVLQIADKCVVGKPEWNAAKVAATNLQSNPKTAKYFEGNNQYQVPLYFKYEGLDCKALLDILRIDEENKTVQNVDVKSTELNTKDWKKHALNVLQVPIQGSFYQEALRQNYPDYKVLDPVFIVESTKYPGWPRAYILNEHRQLAAQYGERIKVSESKVTKNKNSVYYPNIIYRKGWHDAIQIYKKAKVLKIHHWDVDYLTKDEEEL